MTKTKRKAGAKAKPITAHRLFPALAALWFAALFGLASFAVPVELLQRVVVASGLPHLVAAAAPPLGFTARALVALLLTGLGGVIGLALGLRLAARHRVAIDPATWAEVQDEAPVAPRVRARDAHPDAPPRRPLVVSADMIDESETAILIDEPASTLPRPLPALADEALADDLAPAAFDPFAIYETEEEPDDLFVPPPFLTVAREQAAPREEAVEAQSEMPIVAEAEADAVPVAEPEVETAAAAEAEAEAEAQAEPDAVEEADVAAHDPAPVVMASPALTPSLFAKARDAMGESGPSPVAQADLDGLGLVQLVERLALAIADHRRALDSVADDLAGLDGRDVRAMPRPSRLGAADADSTDRGQPEGAVREERYSSLLDMAAAVRRSDPARHFLSGRGAASPQPVVIFPGQGRAQRPDGDEVASAAPAPFERPYLAAVPTRFQAVEDEAEDAPRDAASTEQALRDALATLQRMTAQR
ncbi:hypothetical protein [Novosphingobium capsulatum]|uniref:hypothetical protein n=1 Tax=Novosphingobium capsulatum TaxID=13688 RepID=UPI000787632A|nr:hypothetical protein [Novosphingobium capsulatum]WQD93922.1 hypothetical protein U0041_04855 [Novosphingobium capsulatum]